ncbi:ABC transporter permease [Paenibacillus sp. D9]|uniref:ABC transporter permease n=1 Tax=Paenibacillus TaxID=44249 RepID=UPI0013E34A1B|nr:ABC transporter permease [Paenibacillus sp. D9]
MNIVAKEHFKNRYMIVRIALFQLKSTYMSNRLGLLWVLLNPLSQLAVYWVVFGLGIRGGASVEGVPFVLWLSCGLVPWLFIGSGIVQGANSVSSQLGHVSKMKFPLSVLPSITILTQLISHLIMLVMVLIAVVIKYGFFGLSYLGIVYYLIASLSLLSALALFTSTVSAFVRDFRFVIGAVTRALFFITPIMWTVNAKTPELLKKVIHYNPVTYLVDGYRNAMLFNQFYIATAYTAGFWLGVAVLFVWGAFIHVRFRKHFMDYQ